MRSSEDSTSGSDRQIVPHLGGALNVLSTHDCTLSSHNAGVAKVKPVYYNLCPKTGRRCEQRARRFYVLQPEDLPPTLDGFTQREYDLLRRELAEMQALGRDLRRQLGKALQSANEAQRAHAKMVATLTETMRENTILVNDRDVWRAKAQRLESGLAPEPGGQGRVIDISALASQISEDEVNAIRKAMARLHHPDVGGDPERMKSWNAALDRICD